MPRFHQRVQFQPKANVPMATETRDRIALEIRMAGESLIGHPSIESYNTLSKMLAALNRAGMDAALVDPGSDLLNGICDRYEQAGRISVEPEEAARLRQALADVDAGLHRVPLQRFALAVAEVEVFASMVDPSPTTKK
jgi:hypothetical protein